MIRAVIFDLGGVLVRTIDGGPRTEAAKRLGLTRAQLEEAIFGGEVSLRASRGELGTKELWRQLCAQLSIGDEKGCLELQKAFWGGDRLDRDLIAWIRSLRPAYRTALLSNAWDDLRQALVDVWHILDAFDEVIISAEVGLTKPDPRIYRLALERLGVKPDEAVFVDDLPDNVEGARAAGLHAIQFQNPAQLRADLDRLVGVRPAKDTHAQNHSRT